VFDCVKEQKTRQMKRQMRVVVSDLELAEYWPPTS
jgi:hypothetical protein